ncbi:MAG: hypothetical protein LBC53_00795 [Spirochaetaceae bacterium]|nr:hypothetical protein [Spirochaetaceae bacterium]
MFLRILSRAFYFTLALSPQYVAADVLRITNSDVIEVSAERPAGSQIQIKSGEAAAVVLGKDLRFISALEFEITAPASWIGFQGSLAAGFYSNLDKIPSGYSSDVQARELRFEPLPNKIQTIYQMPIKQAHGLKSSPYVSILRDVVPPEDFPVLFRLLPISDSAPEVENMEFRLNVKPVFSDEGAVRINLRYPDHLPDKPVAVLIDGRVIENPAQERLLKEGEHQLTALSADYRNQNRRFLIERGKSISITIPLQDITPQIIFETPANARIFLDDKLIQNTSGQIAVEPGKHDVKIQVSDYSIMRSINTQKGKTYRISFTIDIAISEHE